MTTTTQYNGRLCNQIIRNLAVSKIAEKNDLFVEYSSYEEIKQLEPYHEFELINFSGNIVGKSIAVNFE